MPVEFLNSELWVVAKNSEVTLVSDTDTNEQVPLYLEGEFVLLRRF